VIAGIRTVAQPLSAGALRAFHDATVMLRVAGRVTTFTASDFGRTLTGIDGSDRGWGGSQLIMGGCGAGRALLRHGAGGAIF
jgi:uncharacterized protein (DUF1501 family)